jgi:flavin reductase (DIM6/NTAB) family NADH-FMN oxidoreductase RutF
VPERAFDDLVAAMDAALLVVTAAAGGERDGCLVGFHTQASIRPPRYAVWLSTANRTWRIAQRATHLGVHLLGRGQLDLARRFGGLTADEGVDKLAGTDWSSSPEGAPVLRAAVAGFVGRVVARIEPDGGDHVAVLLEPLDAWVSAGVAPLRLGAASHIEAGHPPS